MFTYLFYLFIKHVSKQGDKVFKRTFQKIQNIELRYSTVIIYLLYRFNANKKNNVKAEAGQHDRHYSQELVEVNYNVKYSVDAISKTKITL